MLDQQLCGHLNLFKPTEIYFAETLPSGQSWYNSKSFTLVKLSAFLSSCTRLRAIHHLSISSSANHMKFPNFNGVVFLLSFPSSAYLHPTPSARIPFHELLKLRAACSEDLKMDWNNTSAHVSEMTSKTELWGTDAKLSAFGEQRKPRKGLRWTSPQLTYCDESTGSGCPWWLKAFLELSVRPSLKIKLLASDENTITNTPFSLIWSRFGWTLNKWSCVCWTEIQQRRDGNNQMFEVIGTHILLDPVLIETCQSRISLPDLPVQLCSNERKTFTGPIKNRVRFISINSFWSLFTIICLTVAYALTVWAKDSRLDVISDSESCS